MVSLSACGNNEVTGAVFLDKNGNKRLDGGEDRLANLGFTLSKEDEEIERSKTDKNGMFFIEVEESGIEYCVEVSETNLNAADFTRVVATRSFIDQVFNQTLAMGLSSALNLISFIPELQAQVQQVESLCNNNIDDDRDGSADCLDSDCRENEACTRKEICNDNIDNDSDGRVDCLDSDCNSDDACNDDDSTGSDVDDEETITLTVEEGKACNRLEGGELKLDVPISLDFKGLISGIEKENFTKSRTETFTFDLFYPESCTLKSATIPSFLAPLNQDIETLAYSEDTNQFHFQKAVDVASEQANNCLRANIENPTQDNIRKCSFNFIVKNDGSVGDRSGSLKTQAVCPDGTSVDTPEVAVKVDGADDFEIIQTEVDVNGGDPEAGDTMRVSTRVKNNSLIDFAAADMTLKITTPSNVNGRELSVSPVPCEQKSNIFECSFDISSGEEVTFITDFTLPENIESTRNFEAESHVEVIAKGETVTFNGNPVVISVIVEED